MGSIISICVHFSKVLLTRYLIAFFLLGFSSGLWIVSSCRTFFHMQILARAIDL